MSSIPFRVGIHQRILPVYRVPFFETFGAACENGLSVFAGLPMAHEAIESRLALNGVKVYQAENLYLLRRKAYLCWQRGLLRWLEEWKPEVLIVEANPRLLSSFIAIKWMHRRRLPVIGWGLGVPQPTGRLAKMRNLFRNRFYHQFDAMIAYSSRGAEQYIQTGFRKERVYTAVNAAVPRPADASPARFANEVNHPPVVLFVGRLVEQKRVDRLIRSCADLGSIQPRLWIVGDGPKKEELQALAQQLYPSTVFWGAAYGKELDALFEQADVFVLPGTGGLAVQQAMSHGLPVIVAEADGTQADLVHPGNGWIIPAGDDRSLTEVLQRALADPDRLRQMGGESFRLVREEVNLEKMVDVFTMAIFDVKRDMR